MTSADGQGSTVTISGFTAELIDIDGPDESRGTIESTHMGTTVAKTFIPTELIDEGSVTLTVVLDAANDNPPITSAAASVVITFGGSGGPIWTFDAFVTGYKPSASMGERMTATVELKITGAIVKTV